jgi:hypothetical protein
VTNKASGMARLSQWVSRAEKAAEALAIGYYRLIVFLILGGGIYMLLDTAAEDWPLAAQVVLFVFFGTVLASLMWGLAFPDRRKQIFDVVSVNGRVQPVMFMVGVLFVAVGLFSSVTFMLYERDAFELRTDGGEAVAHPGEIGDLYMWQFFNTIPGLDVNSTIRWDQPVTYRSSGMGWLVLLFKTIAILFIIQGFVAAWRWFQTGRGRAPREGPTAAA